MVTDAATDALARALLAAGIRSEPNHPTTLDAAYALDIALAALGYEVRPICTTCTALHSVRSASGMPIHQAAEAHRACLDCGADVDHRLDREWHRLGNADHAWRPIAQAAEAADREAADRVASIASPVTSPSAAADLDTLQTGPYSVDEQFRKAHPADPPCDCGVPWLHPADLPAAVDTEAVVLLRALVEALTPLGNEYDIDGHPEWHLVNCLYRKLWAMDVGDDAECQRARAALKPARAYLARVDEEPS